MRRVWLLAFLGYLLLGSAWAAGVPVNGTYDEIQHIPRAYSVVTGQLVLDGYHVEAPASLLPHNDYLTCLDQKRLAASCQTPPPAAGTAAGDATVKVYSAAARYSPVYYAVVGLPLLVSPDLDGIIAARVLSAALSAALLATALAIAWRLRNRYLVGGLLLVSTPMMMNLAGSVNPNGLEIAAGVLAWVSLLAIVRGEGAPGRLLLWSAGVSGALLLTVRHLGPVLLGIIVLACLVFAKRGRIRELLRNNGFRWLLGGLAIAALLGALWMVVSSVNTLPDDTKRAAHLSLSQTVEQIVRIRTPFYLNQVVGQFSYGELTLPGWAILGWYAFVAALAIPAFLYAGRRYQLAWLGTAAACFAVLAALELYFVPKVGWYSHGRYAMPAGLGLVILAAFTKGLPGDLAVRFTRMVALVTGLLHIYAVMEVTLRYREQVTSMPSPAYAFCAGTAGVLLLGAVAWIGVTGTGVARIGGSSQPTPTRRDPDTPNNVGRSSEDEAGAVAH
ncbi:DUF2142 domain-containing protein [Longispora albida]|uniref:DUF2142 domain-containing protein n=1 Tax=Longispora albida TaxID=203523 RepID=UPI00037A7A02|nr:DUF2142 domain-containing protein [Longispora albida]